MSYIHPSSCECLLSSLDLFSVAPTQLSIDKTKYVEYRPTAALSSGQQLDFTIPSSEEYIDLAQTLFYLKVRVVKSPGVAYTGVEDAGVFPVNLWLHSMFSQVDLTINGKLVTGTNDNYAYKSFLQTLLSYGKEAKDTQLFSSLWSDTANTRRDRIKVSAPVELLGRIHHDLCMQPRLILNNTELKLRFVPHKAPFYMYLDAAAVTAALTPVVEFIDASLFVRKIVPAPAILLAHARALATASAKYPYRKTEIRTHTLITGVSSGYIDNAFNSNVPSRVTIGLVRHDAFNGDYAQDPFFFKPFGLTSLTLSVDGAIYNGKPLTCDFTGKNYMHAYMALFTGLGIPYHNTGIDITYDQFSTGGKCLFSYDLSPDSCANDESHTSLSQNGVVRIEFRFDTALVHNITVVVLGERDALLEIDQTRNVLSTE